AAQAGPNDLKEIEHLARQPKVVAIGEIGMDFYWETETRQVQENIFLQQLELAAALNLPVVIHNRKAGQAILQVLDQVADLPLRGVFHCFSEDETYAQQVLQRGFHISFTGNLTYKKSTLPGIAKEIPLERILLETDSPFMPPVPKRGKRNEPAFVRYIAEKHAEIRQLALEEVAAVTTKNARALFKLPPA
ncbi:MAG: TatD family deoxyribonuclease, partial [Calditrichaeota bacterium]